jgi:hypothetical protein
MELLITYNYSCQQKHHKAHVIPREDYALQVEKEVVHTEKANIQRKKKIATKILVLVCRGGGKIGDKINKSEEDTHNKSIGQRLLKHANNREREQKSPTAWKKRPKRQKRRAPLRRQKKTRQSASKEKS